METFPLSARANIRHMAIANQGLGVVDSPKAGNMQQSPTLVSFVSKWEKAASVPG